VEKQAGIRKVLQDLKLEYPHYQNMQWRLDIQVGSKSVHNTTEPAFLMRIDTDESHSGQGKQSHHLQADYSNLEHMYQELNTALQAVKQPQYRLITRVAK